MRNLDISDTRDKLMLYGRTGLLKPSTQTPLPLIADGNAASDGSAPTANARRPEDKED